MKCYILFGLLSWQIDLKGNIKNNNKSKQKDYLRFNEEFHKHNFNDLTEFLSVSFLQHLSLAVTNESQTINDMYLRIYIRLIVGSRWSNYFYFAIFVWLTCSCKRAMIIHANQTSVLVQIQSSMQASSNVLVVDLCFG